MNLPMTILAIVLLVIGACFVIFVAWVEISDARDYSKKKGVSFWRALFRDPQ